MLCRLFLSESGLGAAPAGGYGGSSRRDYDDGGSGSPRKLNLDGLPHFEKNFYSESPAVRAMTEAEVTEYRQLREITVEGRDVPKPVKTFNDAGFPGTLANAYQYYGLISLVYSRTNDTVQFNSIVFNSSAFTRSLVLINKKNSISFSCFFHEFGSGREGGG